ncbi:AI-2E family transporter [Clostridium sp. ZS2-4]|uniref:AI-2E family transporter n=1 Tax=Clostridium sp. ZS2-4 TaxID=2987703 RepID=UPI00227C1905|nr:AI-2E family transporter [Clostridium sp. ZS2-4]MCY6356630.1 AI-2E family transporter [Clostridium sp. ZS2-4]
MVILLIFISSTYIIKNYFKPFFIIIFITFICKPIYDLLCKYRIFNENVNAVLSILFVNLILFFTAYYTGKILFDKLYAIALNNYSNIINQLDNISSNLNDFFQFDLLKLDENIKNIYSNIARNGYLKKGAVYTTNGIFAYFISNIAVYFILVDKYVIVNTIEKLFPKGDVCILKVKFNEINNIFKIELILILLTTLETLIGFIILKVNNALFLSILCGVLDIIPYIGTILVFIPLIIYNFILKNNIIAIGLIILYIFLQVIRQVSEAKFVSKKFEIHPLILILSIYIGIKIFGIIGLFMAPLYIITTKKIIFSA